jgi:rod shape determining protein RodA
MSDTYSISLHRPFRDRSFGLVRKFLRINWLFVLCVCAARGRRLYRVVFRRRRFADALCQQPALSVLHRPVADAGDCDGGYPHHRRISWFTYALGILLLLVVMKFGHTGLGAKRWMTVGGVEIQPSELMKLFLTLAIAAYFHKASHERTATCSSSCPPPGGAAAGRADPEGAQSRHGR